MKKKLQLLAIASLFGSSSAMSGINVELDRDINILAINGESLGFTLVKERHLELEDGVNQLVVRIEKLITSEYGEKEKYNSVPVIMTFDASDVEVELSASKNIKYIKESVLFDKNPMFLLKDPQAKTNVLIKQNILSSSGGFTRDYELEIARYNAKNDIALSDTSIAVLETENKAKEKLNVERVNTVVMIKHWYSKASEKDKKTFTELAFDARKNDINLVENLNHKELDMMVHWYNESTDEQKKKVISWLFEK
ncbi:YccT family protein [Aliivibrio salmonicida]|uniref:YccT family protein n=1 Tax=Aliivibrio salmonicida TaxID=40269 RepID=UPI00406C0199